MQSYERDISFHTFLAQALMAVAYARGATARAQGEAATIKPNARYSEPRTPEQQQQHHNQYWLSNRELSCKMCLCLQQDVSMLLEKVRRWNISTGVGNENLCLEMKKSQRWQGTEHKVLLQTKCRSTDADLKNQEKAIWREMGQKQQQPMKQQPQPDCTAH